VALVSTCANRSRIAVRNDPQSGSVEGERGSQFRAERVSDPRHAALHSTAVGGSGPNARAGGSAQEVDGLTRALGQESREAAMDEDRFNMEVRKFLKEVGVTSQREIERVVREGHVKGGSLTLRMTLASEDGALEHVVERVIRVDHPPARSGDAEQ
jgi:hypothetical protein